MLEGLTVQSIPLCASGTSHEDLSIPISVMPFTREVDIITTPIDFLMNSVEQVCIMCGVCVCMHVCIYI